MVVKRAVWRAAAVFAAIVLVLIPTASSASPIPEEGDPWCKPMASIYPENGYMVFYAWTKCYNPLQFQFNVDIWIDDEYFRLAAWKSCLGPDSVVDGMTYDEQYACGLAGTKVYKPIQLGLHEYTMAVYWQMYNINDAPTVDTGVGDLWYDGDPMELGGPAWGAPVLDDTAGPGGSSPARAEPAMMYDQGNASMKIYRWYSNGSALGRLSDYQSGAFHLSNVGDRVASGDVDGDGRDDIVAAYQQGDGTFSFYVFKRGLTGAGRWYDSGPYNLSGVAGRLVVGDFTGDGLAEPALVRDDGDGTMTIYRWKSTGSSFTRLTDYHSGPFGLGNVGDRVASGDVTGDGVDDIVMAYQLGDGRFAFYVFRSGSSSLGQWYVSGAFGLGPVAGRMVVADFTGDGRAEPALVRDNGDGTMRIYRWSSTGSSFTRAADYNSGAFSLSNVGDRVASGDVTGDGRADIVMAYQNADGTSTLHVFESGSRWAGRWYTGGQYNLSNVDGRLVVGNWY